MLEPRYQPFQLAESSAFNKAKVSPKQWAAFSQVQKAKYLAYHSPSPLILHCVAHSEKRVDALLKDEKRRRGDEASRLQKYRLATREAGEVGAEAARQRMQKRHQYELEAKVSLVNVCCRLWSLCVWLAKGIITEPHRTWIYKL